MTALAAKTIRYLERDGFHLPATRSDECQHRRVGYISFRRLNKSEILCVGYLFMRLIDRELVL